MLKRVIFAIFVIVMCFSSAACSDGTEIQGSNNTVSRYSDEKYWYQSGREISEDKPDVFYVVSTVLLASYDENGNETEFANLNSDDIKAMDSEISDIATNMFTEEFNFFAPYYYEVTMNTFVSATTEKKQEYFAKVQIEINEAFDYYYYNLNNGRPFVIAGYSQGSIIVKGLLKHMTDKQMESMAAAYIMGGPINEQDLEDGHITPAEHEDDLHVAISYNSVSGIDACWDTLTGDNVTCINPVNWKTDETPATFVYDGKEGTVHIDNTAHVLIVDGFNPNDYYLPDWPFPLGNYHNEEIHFYASYIRENALLRLNKLMESK